MLAPAEVAGDDEEEWAAVKNGEPLEAEIEPLSASPKLPSPADVEDHRLTHNPVRSWCKICIVGRGLGEK